MESLINYLAFEIKTKMVDLLPWWQQISKATFNGLEMQLEEIFWKIIGILWLFFSKCNAEKMYLKIYQWLTDLYVIKHKPWK